MTGPPRVEVVLLTSTLLTDAGSTLSVCQTGTAQTDPAQTVEQDELVTGPFEDGNAEAAVEVTQPIADDRIRERVLAFSRSLPLAAIDRLVAAVAPELRGGRPLAGAAAGVSSW